MLGKVDAVLCTALTLHLYLSDSESLSQRMLLEKADQDMSRNGKLLDCELEIFLQSSLLLPGPRALGSLER